VPFAAISGAVYSGNPSWSTPEERRAALGRWISVIAREVGNASIPQREIGGGGFREIAPAFNRERIPSQACP